ncbi:uncharacterized protein N0V89_004153 [Didymosphaeria variabile]|uniref:Uncharacterized protein n=1 Tax=Didymosphaeria variabile TaxID=1932322 RepID=A0A9W9CCX4_9PLEO|nr:uncharacterized protein N0V89_004153 [Didymosphaeria variabile]KAJ4356125.1 hypothetical protein N0V89_004153 [Didymosphaeria variabile]
MASLPNFLTPAGHSRFELNALLNSSVSAADAAITRFNLQKHTIRTYGSPDDLANDRETDLKLTSTRTDKHYEATLASIKAGKDA